MMFDYVAFGVMFSFTVLDLINYNNNLKSGKDGRILLTALSVIFSSGMCGFYLYCIVQKLI